LIPAVAGIGAALAVVALVLLVAPLRGRLRLVRDRRKAARKLAHGRPSASPNPGKQGADLREAAVVRDGERALEHARREARSIVSAAEEQAAREVEQMKKDAKRIARGIIREAQERAQGIVDDAELQLADAKRNVTREQELAEQTRRELTTLLHDLLAEAKSPPVPQPANLHALGRAAEATLERPS
jgi:hypothetical protein